MVLLFIPTRFQLGCYSVLLGSALFLLGSYFFYVRNFDGSVESFSLNKQLKKMKRNNTEQKKSVL